MLIALLAAPLLLLGCGGGAARKGLSGGDTVRFAHATLLQLIRCDGYTIARLADPWNAGKTLHTYILVPRGSDIPAGSLPAGGTVVRTPLTRAVSFTTVHANLAAELGRSSAIAGIADLKYVKIPYILEGCRSGRIADVGSSMSPDVEKIIDLSPDAVLLSPFENSGGYGRLEKTGIPIIECSDYMEPTALGRAEWMRFYGLLFGAVREADSLFAVVDSSYAALKTIAARSPEHRSVLMDKKTGSVWYVPGGRSTIGGMLADAGAVYPFASDTHAGSLSLPFETVLDRAGDADVWLFRYSAGQPMTYGALLSEFYGYGRMRPFRERRCYGCNLDETRFFEETPFRPDLLLADFIRIASPGAGLPGSLRYYKALEK